MRVEALKKVAVALGAPPHREKLAAFDLNFNMAPVPEKFDVGLLAHEGGHSKVHGRLGKWYSKFVPASHAVAGIGGPVGALAIGHGSETPYRKMSTKEKNLRRRLAAVTDVGLYTPKLIDEGAATLIGLRDLRKGQIDPAAYKAIRKRLGAAFGTYAAAPAGKALAHGVNEYAAYKGGGTSPFVASLLGSVAGVPIQAAAVARTMKLRGHMVNKDELENWAKKMKVRVPIEHKGTQGAAEAHFMPGFQSERMTGDPAYRRGHINLPAE